MRTFVVALAFLSLSVGLRGDEAKKLDLSAAEKQVVELTNKEREKEKRPALKADPILMKIAREHSKNMAKQDKLDHKLDDKEPSDRAADAGYKGRYVGENIALGLNALPPEMAVRIWMESEGHRKNILNENYQEIGVGWAKSATGKVYWTQVFGKPTSR